MRDLAQYGSLVMNYTCNYVTMPKRNVSDSGGGGGGGGGRGNVIRMSENILKF